MKRVKIVVLIAAAGGVMVLGSTLLVGSSGRANFDDKKIDAKALFNGKCAMCHGRDGKGTSLFKDQNQPDFTDAKWQESRKDEEITDSIKNGKGKLMPTWKEKLSEAEITALVGYIRAFKKS